MKYTNPGRPSIGDKPMSVAERQAARRKKRKDMGYKQYSIELIDSDIDELSEKLGCTKNAAVKEAAIYGINKLLNK